MVWPGLNWYNFYLINVRVGRVVVVGGVASEAFLIEHCLVQGVQDLDGDSARKFVFVQASVVIQEIFTQVFT